MFGGEAPRAQLQAAAFQSHFAPQHPCGLSDASYSAAPGCHTAMQHARPPLPAAPAAGSYPQHRGAAHSTLTYSLQSAGHGAQTALVPAATGGRAPPPTQASYFAPQPTIPPAMYTSDWQAAYAASQQHPVQQAYSVAAAGVPTGHGMFGGASAAAAAVGWPALLPHAGSLELFHAHAQAQVAHAQVQAAQAQAALQQGAAAVAAAAAGAQLSGRRVRRRRPTARRSLLNLFDAAAIDDQSEYDSEDDSDSDCEMVLCSQDSFTSCASLASPGLPSATFVSTAPSPTTPASAGPVGTLLLAPSPFDASAGPSPAGTPPPPGSGDEHMLPLQHLLMSERAQHLTALEVKAIVFKVSADLAALHDGGVLHRHVTIASVALSRSGSVASTRLMGHPYNVEAGQGRRYTGGKKAGVDAYLAPELARCPCDCVAYTPAGDMWSLGVVLFVLLSGSHVPFGNRGLCWTSIPNMPGPAENVDKLQHWLEEHLTCKLGVINQLKQSQEKGKALQGAGPEMRVVGVDEDAADLMIRLLAADPAARPTARQVLSHPWLAEVEGLIPSPHRTPTAAAAAAAGDTRSPSPADLAAGQALTSPGFEARLHMAASDLACLGFSPATPEEDPQAEARGLYRHSSNLSAASSECLWECTSGGRSSNSSAYNSSACLAELSGAQAQPLGEPRSFQLADGSTRQLLSQQTVEALAAGGVLPDPSSCSSGSTALPYRALGYAAQPVEVTVEGQRMQLSAIHAVYDVNGQPMMHAEPVAVTQQQVHAMAGRPQAAAGAARPSCPPRLPAPQAPAAAASQAASNADPDLGTSAPILPLLARILQQQCH